MDLSGAGTAIMLAIAAALWFLYLMPTWVRRREYLATERSAARIQQTMRIMAESAEMPDSVRLSVTARDAARAERLLLAQQRRADAEIARRVRAERAATPRTVAERPPRMVRADAEALRRARMRRGRAGASLVMVAATAVGLVQIWLFGTTGMSLAGALVIGGAFVAGAVSVALHAQLSARTLAARIQSREAMRAAAAAAPVAEPVARPAARDASVVRSAPVPWTPVPVPQPLYLSRPAPQRVAVSPVPVVAEMPVAPVAPVTPIRVAASAAPAVPAPAATVASAAPVAVAPAPAAPSRWAAMGVLDELDTAAPDLDAVLRRRRAVG